MNHAAVVSPTVRRAHLDELPETADFMAQVIRQDTRYISHGEIQTGLSIDGRTWADDLQTKMREDFADLGPGRRVYVAHVDDVLVGVGVAVETQDDRARYIVVEDIAVSVGVRSAGVGRRMMDFIEAEARENGCQWAFLESGVNNRGAHAFFERRDYQPLSKVFCKRL